MDPSIYETARIKLPGRRREHIKQGINTFLVFEWLLDYQILSLYSEHAWRDLMYMLRASFCGINKVVDGMTLTINYTEQLPPFWTNSLP